MYRSVGDSHHRVYCAFLIIFIQVACGQFFNFNSQSQQHMQGGNGDGIVNTNGMENNNGGGELLNTGGNNGGGMFGNFFQGGQQHQQFQGGGGQFAGGGYGGGYAQMNPNQADFSAGYNGGLNNGYGGYNGGFQAPQAEIGSNLQMGMVGQMGAGGGTLESQNGFNGEVQVPGQQSDEQTAMAKDDDFKNGNQNKRDEGEDLLDDFFLNNIIPVRGS